MTRDRSNAVEGNVLVSEWGAGENPPDVRRARERLVSRDDVTGWVAVRRAGERPGVPVRGVAQLAREMGVERLAVVDLDEGADVAPVVFPGVEVERRSSVDDAVQWAGRSGR